MKRAMLFLLLISAAFATLETIKVDYPTDWETDQEAFGSISLPMDCPYYLLLVMEDGGQILACSQENTACPSGMRLYGEYGDLVVEYNDGSSSELFFASSAECLGSEEEFASAEFLFRAILVALMLIGGFAFAWAWSFILKRRLVYLGIVAAALWLFMKLSGLSSIHPYIAAMHIGLLGLAASCVIVHLYRRIAKK